MVFPLIKTGGFIGADNILWPERFAGLMKLYVEHVRNNPKFRSVTVPIDNGEEISIKIVH
jgi:predicted O-methyltransferase YrrM